MTAAGFGVAMDWLPPSVIARQEREARAEERQAKAEAAEREAAAETAHDRAIAAFMAAAVARGEDVGAADVMATTARTGPRSTMATDTDSGEETA